MAIVQVLAVLLVLGALGGIGYGITQYGITPSARDAKYHGEAAGQSIRNKIRAEARYKALLDGIKAEWLPRIRKSENKAAGASVQAGRALARGKNPAKYLQRAMQHDAKAKTSRDLMNRELKLTGGLHDSAREGSTKARTLVGKIDPKTGHTSGGFGRAGHRPADHMPQILQRKPRPVNKTGGAIKKSLKDIIIGQPKPRRR